MYLVRIKVPPEQIMLKKRDIDCSTLYSFDGPFQLLHADVGNLEFIGKIANFPQYVLVIGDLFSSKVYTCSLLLLLGVGKHLLQNKT